jgi:membrane fusion protein, heavy metal efflux system
MRNHLLLPLAALLFLPACSQGSVPDDAGSQEQGNGEEAAPLAGLDITTAQAVAETDLPLGTVPGVISLPPEARVAVTSPFAGAAVRVFVIEGQQVRRGQPLALVRAAESVQIRGDLSRAQSELSLAEARHGRLRQLAEEGIIAPARVDEAQAQLQQARASVAENRRLASFAGAGADGAMTLSAPISGRVQHVGIDTGGPVDPLTAPFVIEAASAYRIDLQLPERLARVVRPGMPVEVQIPVSGGAPMLVAGSILSVSPSIDPATRSVVAKASIGAAPGLVPGQNVMATILGTGNAGGVSVPSGAVTRSGTDSHVFVRTGQSFTSRRVTVAAEAGGHSVIADGLQPGEEVATSGLTELKAMAAE